MANGGLGAIPKLLGSMALWTPHRTSTWYRVSLSLSNSVFCRFVSFGVPRVWGSETAIATHLSVCLSVSVVRSDEHLNKMLRCRRIKVIRHYFEMFLCIKIDNEPHCNKTGTRPPTLKLVVETSSSVQVIYHILEVGIVVTARRLVEAIQRFANISVNQTSS